MFYVIDICEVMLVYAFYITNSHFGKASIHIPYDMQVHCHLRVACTNNILCNSTLLRCSQFILPHNVFESCYAEA